MGREVWGTYSVRDHLDRQPWVADVLLYDRLVIPVPPPAGSPEREAEWQRWDAAGWNPGAQERLIEILGDRAFCIPWDATMRDAWEDEWNKVRTANQFTAESTTPWVVTAGVLAGLPLPSHVTAVNAVATYRSRADLDRALELRQLVPTQLLAGGQAVAVIGREFLVPNPDDGDDTDQLRAAVEIAADSDVRRRRIAFWRWQREFLRDGNVTADAIADAVSEMADLIADEQRAIRRCRFRLATMFAFCVATAATGLLAGPLAPATIGGAFLSIGQFAASEAFTAAAPNQPPPSALLYDTRRQLGWD